MPFDAEKFKQELDSMGYEKVRMKLATDETWYNYEPRSKLAQEWVRFADDSKRDSREDRTRHIAICANIIATIAAIAAIAAAFIAYLAYSVGLK